MRRVLRATILLALLAYAGAAAWLAANERSLVFHPARRAVQAPSAALALDVRPVAFRAADSTRIAAWVIPAAGHDSTAPWMIICHGNYGNIGYGGRTPFYAGMRDLGVNLLAFDYRGFGASEGEPSEAGVYADARAAYEWLRTVRHVP
ncbi:MAG TPA: alpha/beta hydrolase, partial [Gammaproteobacteria bacterium]|nr:alpha/beta hydrolase [Gammaproteobacteria bacterium]